VTEDEAAAFAAEWYAAWNSHDLDRIMGHWADDAVFTSPFAERIVGQTTLEGKAALREYWAKGLDAIPDLRFEPRRLLVGAESIVLSYTNNRGQECAEMLVIGPDHLAHRGYAHYGPIA
jgi:ketosteroid isomerase-like protein